MATIRGGAKFTEAINDIAKRLDSGVVRVGFLEGATYASGANDQGADWANGKPVAMVAAIQNYGAPSRGIPPRPFFSNMVKEKSAEWPKAIAQNLRETGYDVPLTLERVGQGVAGQLRQSIVDTNSPPLSPKTVARKGFSKPLVDSGHMLNSVDYEVNMKR